VTELEAAESAAPLGRLLLSEALEGDECWASWYIDIDHLIADAEHVYVLLREEEYDSETGEYRYQLKLAVVAIGDGTEPELASVTDLVSVQPDYYSARTVRDVGSSVVLSGSTLVVHRVERDPDDYSTAASHYEVVDVSNPTAVQRLDPVAGPSGVGFVGLQVEGDMVFSSHWEALDSDASSARFYLDRLDLSDPDSPQLLESINLPGSVLSYDATEQRAMTIDYQRDGGDWEYTAYLVDVGRDAATVADSAELGHDSPALAAVGEDRVFLTPNPYASDGDEVMVLSGLVSGTLQLAATTLSSNVMGEYQTVRADGARCVLATAEGNQLAVIDAGNPTDPVAHTEGPLYGVVAHINLVGDRAICALGTAGVQSVGLTD
jgi:hypothetical protein